MSLGELVHYILMQDIKIFKVLLARRNLQRRQY